MALRRVRASARAGFDQAAARWRRRPRPGNELTDRDRLRLRERIEACLDPRLSGVAIRNRAGEVADVVVTLDRNGLLAFFQLLLESFGPQLDRVQRALDDTADVLTPIRGDAAEPARALAAVAALRDACAPRWETLFELLCGLRSGVKLAVDLRAELLALLREHPELAPLDADLQRVLSRLFPAGLLELRRITWNSPGALLEKLIDYEAVHEITSWEDLKNRLDDHDRRCYAFIHPGMPDEPLIFVEVALVDAIAGNVVHLLDISAPNDGGHEASTAIFYSISACQPGLAGVNLGDVLIKEVVADLTRDLPRLNQFATLSPLPGFRRWLDGELARPDPTVLSAEDLATIAELTPDGATGPAALAALLAGDLGDAPGGDGAHKALRELLIGLCVDYLLPDRPGRSRDRVANFHLTNGAQVERINWMANATAAGLRESYGLMVNYRYDLSRIDSNHEQYVTNGIIARSSGIARIATNRRKARAARAETH